MEETMEKEFFLEAFDRALNFGAKYVVIAVQLETGATELIINTENLADKRAYYDKAYNDNLEHVNNNNVKIKNYMFA